MVILAILKQNVRSGGRSCSFNIYPIVELLISKDAQDFALSKNINFEANNHSWETLLCNRKEERNVRSGGGSSSFNYNPIVELIIWKDAQDFALSKNINFEGNNYSQEELLCTRAHTQSVTMANSEGGGGHTHCSFTNYTYLPCLCYTIIILSIFRTWWAQ